MFRQVSIVKKSDYHRYHVSVGRGVHKSPFDRGLIQNTVDFFGLKLGRLRPSELFYEKLPFILA